MCDAGERGADKHKHRRIGSGDKRIASQCMIDGMAMTKFERLEEQRALFIVELKPGMMCRKRRANEWQAGEMNEQ